MKDVVKNYNFVHENFPIGAYIYEKIMNPQNYGIHKMGISRLPLESPRTKNHFNVIPMARSKVYYEGEKFWLLFKFGLGECNESKISL